MADEKAHPLSGKIDSREALLAALRALNRPTRVISKFTYRGTKRKLGVISDETYHLWRDELRLYTSYWVRVPLPNTYVCEQDKTLHLTKYDDQAFVAFAETEEKQKRDILTRMRFGKYLTRFHPEIDNEGVKKLVADFEYKYGALPELRIGEKKADFVRAIKNGPGDSCQADKFYSGSRFEYRGHEHPAVCYASGDIQVAWLENSAGEVTARALINKAKKYHSRSYGDTGRIDRLLSDAGYEKRSGALIGCRLLKIENQDGCGWLMPYVDAGTGSGGGSLRAYSDGDYWVLNDDGSGVDTYCGYDAAGVTKSDEDEEPEHGYCENCGCRLDDGDDYTYSEYEGQTYCTSCADQYWSYAVVGVRNGHHVYDYVSTDSCTYIDCINEYALDDVVGELDVVYDEIRCEWIALDDAVRAVDDEEYYHVDDCVEAGTDSGETLWLHEQDLKDNNLREKIYYDADDTPFWYKSDEIVEWIESGDEPERYSLRELKVEVPMVEVPMVEVPMVVGTCPEPEPCPRDGTWQEKYRWMQSRGVLFDCRATDPSSPWTPMRCYFDADAEPCWYRIRPEQPEVSNWRVVYTEAQAAGVKFECTSSFTSTFASGTWLFSGLMSHYRIQEEREEVAA